MNDKLFQKNVALWAKSCPKEAVMLPYADCQCFEACLTDSGEPNLKRLYGSSIIFYHAQEGAASEAEAWFETVPKKDIPLLMVYGVGLGYYYDVAKKWLKEDSKRYLIFLEDDLSIIHKLFETQRGTEILQDRQVQLLHFSNLKDEEGTLEVLYWNFALTRIAVSALRCYAEKKGHFLEQLRHKIAHDAAIKNALVDEYMRYGGAFFINFYQNMLYLPQSYLGNRFFGKFFKVPAIICGAGPSLSKNVALLGSLLDKAVVFAGGSALNVLNAARFQPHFGAGIDPNSMQLARLSSSQGYEVPFFYRNRLFHEAFHMIHGPRLYVTGSGGYDVAEYFEEKFDIKADFLDEGHNVVNFCVQVAQEMGCDPIIFVGMDLAFTGMKEYAPGVVEDATICQTKILDIEDEDDRALLKHDIHGEPVYTLWKWIAEAEWLGNFAKEHPAITMINCTEGGLGFPDIPNKTLCAVAEKYLHRTYELKNRIHGETQNSIMPQVTDSTMAEIMEELVQGLKRTYSYLQVLIAESEAAIIKIKAGQEIPGQSGKAALAEIELAEEPAYKYVVDIFNAVYSRMLNRELHEINTRRYSEKLRIIKRLTLNIQKLSFLRDVTNVNIELIDYAFKEKNHRIKNKKLQEQSMPLVNQKGDSPAEYSYEEQRFYIKDIELEIFVDEAFAPALIPKGEYKDGQILSSGHRLRVFYDANWKLSECYLELNSEACLQDGQCVLFYPNGLKKEELFYREGHLHGPSTFWTESGQVLAKSWFLNGQQLGKSCWHYPSGALYSLQRYQGNQWNGQQEFYYQNGCLKSLMSYEEGQIVGEPLLLNEDGSSARVCTDVCTESRDVLNDQNFPCKDE
ncbi:MAG: DUF115 domain-containing protein [Parachlamydiaceae bacterium]|nr:DUF115 domain-containing protein [Parachlamydiaceae bacterium]